MAGLKESRYRHRRQQRDRLPDRKCAGSGRRDSLCHQPHRQAQRGCRRKCTGRCPSAGDIGNAEAMKTLVAELAAKHNDCLNFLVNNAGVSYKCRAEDFPMEQFDNIMNVNVKYLFQMSVICYPYLKKSADKGRIINITSMSAHLGFSEVVPYCASKGAVLAMTRALAVEWAQDNITVNSIAPGWFRSKMNEQVVDAAREQKILNRMPLHAYGDTRDLGKMAEFLVGDGAAYITGQDFAVDGGALAFGY